MRDVLSELKAAEKTLSAKRQTASQHAHSNRYVWKPKKCGPKPTVIPSNWRKR